MKATQENRMLLALRFLASAGLFLATGICGSSSQRRLLLLAAVGLLLAFQAGAGDAKVSSLRVVSGQDPLPPYGAPGGYCGTYPEQQDWEQETTLAVNPRNPKNIVAAWIQDFADAIVVAYSMDGGGHWTVVVPATTPCTGGVTEFGTAPGAVSAIDEHLSFGADGILYLSENVGPGVVINTSLDGGKTWSPPLVVDAPSFPYIDDWTNILADPLRPGYAYLLWNRNDLLSTSRNEYVSHTTDAGKTWSSPAQILSPQLQVGGQFFVLPDSEGTLINIVVEIPPQPAYIEKITTGPSKLMTRRSTDFGDTWSAPTVIAVTDPTRWIGGSAALAPDGTTYAAWTTPDATESSFTLSYSKSTDGGQSWQPPSAIGGRVLGPPDTSSGGFAVAPDGTVGLTFYDHRNDIPGTSPPRVTYYWLRYSNDGGVSWKEEHLAGPFDQTTAPSISINSNYPNGAPGRVAGGFLGDYQGFAAIAGGFVNAFALAKPVGATGTPNADGFYANPTDIYFAKVSAAMR